MEAVGCRIAGGQEAKTEILVKTPITKDHPAYACMTDRDKDGQVCE